LRSHVGGSWFADCLSFRTLGWRALRLKILRPLRLGTLRKTKNCADLRLGKKDSRRGKNMEGGAFATNEKGAGT